VAATAQRSESLRDEIEAVERASRALSQRRCGLAREHLAAYEARFPNGKLRREAEVVAIEIAGRSGQSERARTAARRFVAQFPDTPYALRLAPWLREDAPEAAGPGGLVMCTDAAE
jgi:outer membrane protein assembly factor BamD (BamD/ComL family)